MALKWFRKKDKKTPDQQDPRPQDETAQIDSEGQATPAPAQDNEMAAPEALPVNMQPPPRPDGVSDDLPPAEAGAQTPLKAAQPKKKKSLFQRLKKGLSKTRDILTTDIEDLFVDKRQIDDDLLEELEELLITSDMGIQTAMDLMKIITKKAARISGPDELKAVLKQEILKLLEDMVAEPPTQTQRPHVVMVVGVNGVGKTTTIGKLAARNTQTGKRVLIAAADTFRAAAVEQLAIWAERAGAELVKHKPNADPAAVAFDSLEAAMARGIDTVYVDTAGRLHTKVNLMEELKKIRRTIGKKIPDAPHEVLLVLDATTGQNALSQAKLFNEAMGITSLALTKLDGTAKGGIVISICQSLNIPLHYIGVGEGIEDLQVFDPVQFADAMF